MNDDDTGYLSKTVNFSIPIGALGILTIIGTIISLLLIIFGWVPGTLDTSLAITGTIIGSIFLLGIIIICIWAGIKEYREEKKLLSSFTYNTDNFSKEVLDNNKEILYYNSNSIEDYIFDIDEELFKKGIVE